MDLVRRAGLRAEPGEEGTDAGGVSIESWTVGDLGVALGGATLPLTNVVAFVGPESFGGWGVGGFLSPQHLHPSATVILDFAGAELTIVDGAPADVGATLIRRFADLHPIWLDRNPGDTTVRIKAGIEPFPPVVALLDSGGKSTEFAASAVPGLAAADRVAGDRSVSGAQSQGFVTTDQILRVGDARLPLPRLFVSPAMHGTCDGLIGMDILRHTVLVVSANVESRLLWLVPS